MKGFCKSFSNALLAIAIVCVMALPAFATGSVTLADPGFLVTDYFTAFATQLGTIVAAAIGVWLVFMAIRRGIKWLRG